jgi:flagellar basal body rod protein FlgB
MVRTREIAHRVANASNGTTSSFESALDQAIGGDEVDVEMEMVQLADEQIRYEATGQILQKMYGQLRATMRSA